eukprot:4956711-Amphidinium_carterae.1
MALRAKHAWASTQTIGLLWRTRRETAAKRTKRRSGKKQKTRCEQCCTLGLGKTFEFGLRLCTPDWLLCGKPTTLVKPGSCLNGHSPGKTKNVKNTS